MQKSARVLFLFSVIFLLISCGGGENSFVDPSGDKLTLLRSLNIEAGDQCLAGGVEIESGFDSNENGSLDNSEVTSSKIVCHGSNGYNSLIRIADELAGVNCQAGGKAITTGMDQNRDSVLDDNEISLTQYICNGITGSDGEQGDRGVADGCDVADNGNGTKTLSCDNGNSVLIADGAGCTVTSNNDGTKTVNCDDGTSAIINNDLINVTPSVIGSRRDNPVPLGQTLITEFWEIKVIEVIRGKEALEIVLSGGDSNDPLEEGIEYMLANINVRYMGDKQEGESIWHYDFRSTGEHNILYQHPLIFGFSELDADLFTGGQVTEWVGLLIGESEQAPLLVTDSGLSAGENKKYMMLE